MSFAAGWGLISAQQESGIQRRDKSEPKMLEALIAALFMG